MPKKDIPVYIGIDPGSNGAIAVLETSGVVTTHKLKNATIRDSWEFLRKTVSGSEFFAFIEEQIPRPTSFFDRKTKRWTATILKSTCLLFGSYKELCGLLAASDIRYEIVTPRTWQKGMGMVPKRKGEKETSWKNRLKAKAQQLFPQVKVTLATADALLLAEYCRRRVLGIL